MDGGFVPPTPRNLPCPECGHEHTFLPCDWCLCDHLTRLGIDTALGG